MKPFLCIFLLLLLMHARSQTHTHTRTQFDRILQKVASVVPGPKPTYIFEVSTSDETFAEEKFRGYKQQFSSTFGYHGSKLESFHSTWPLYETICS